MDTNSQIRILIADDHKMMLDGLRSLLSGENNISIVGQALNGLEVMDILAAQAVDIAVLDISMPEMDGYDTVLKMAKLYPATKVIILSLHKDEKYIGKLLNSGVAGYIIKERGSEELVKAINIVAGGKDYFDSEVKEIGIRALKNTGAGPEKEIKLTTREKEVLHLIAEGLGSKDIGKQLFIAESTVETHRKNLLAKLGIANSKMLMKHAIDKGYGKSPLS